MNRRDFLKALSCAAASFSISGCACEQLSSSGESEKKLNFLFILIDDLGWRDVGCYGSMFYETPNIDQLAGQGMLFTQAYSACPVCSPTRASLMTGKDTARVGFTGHITAIGRHRHPKNSRIIPPDDNMFLPHQETTIAEALKPAGYASASIGKWHLGSEEYWPTKQGFDLNIAGWTHGSPPAYFYPYEKPGNKWNSSIPTLHGGKPGEYLTDRLTDEAIGFIRQNKDRPFFLYMTHYAVHTPLQAPQPLIEKYKAKLKTHPSKINPVYAAMVENMDTNVGRLLETLRTLNLEEQTVVIFTSDNGGLAKVTDNAPLRAGKGHIYEGGIRVPLIVRWPGKVSPNTTCPEPVTSEDLYPTITEIVGRGVNPGKNLDGQSLLPLLTGKGTFKPRSLYWYYPHYSPQAKNPAAAIRSGDFKLIEFYDPPALELYNLTKDPAETNNLTRTFPEKTKNLRTDLNTYLKSAKTKMHTPNPQHITPPPH